MSPPLSLTDAEVRSITSYSLRRKLASVADRLMLPLERKSELGDWRGPVSDGAGGWRSVREPMCVRYSAARLETSATSRRVCLQAMHEVLAGGSVDDEDVRHHQDFPRLLKLTQGPEWGAAVPPNHVEEEVEDEAGVKDDGKGSEVEQWGGGESDVTSSSTDSASVASTTLSSERVGADEVQWLLPNGAKSRLHLLSNYDSEDEAIPWCRRRPFKWGCECQAGLESAEATGRRWSPRCRRRLDSLLGSQ